MTRTLRGAIGMAIIAASAPGAAAPKAANSPIVGNLLACQQLTDNAARLACYDTAAAAFQAAQDRKELVVLDKAGVNEVKKSAFGFSGIRIKLFGGRDDEEPQVTEIKSTLTRVQPLRYGMYLYILEDGSAWQTTEEQQFAEPRGGMPIVIRAGILSSYFAKVGKYLEVRVKRVR